MQTIISFKNIENIEILRFTNLKKIYDDDFKFIVFDLSVDFEFFKAETKLDGEEFDFINMKKCLEKIYAGEWKSFVFNPIEEQFQMQFDLQENGQIKVRAKLNNPMFTGRLEFEFRMSPTYIPDLLKEIEILLTN